MQLQHLQYAAATATLPCVSQACLLPSGDKVVVYGGEDSHRRPLGDVHVLDLQVRMCWGQEKALDV
jgi:hypothetical protein